MVTRIITYRNASAPRHLSLSSQPLKKGKHQLDLHLQPDWERLVGQHVEIRQCGRLVRRGVVEAVMPDNSILWLSAEWPWPREMVERSRGQEVFARYEWDLPKPRQIDRPSSTKDRT